MTSVHSTTMSSRVLARPLSTLRIGFITILGPLVTVWLRLLSHHFQTPGQKKVELPRSVFS